MRISFYSNFLNHHQLPFCQEMVNLLGDGFTFVATEPVPEERLAMGYHDMNHAFPFVLNAYSSQERFQEAVRLGDESDVVIIGSAPRMFVKKRIKVNKLTFTYSERLFKKGLYQVLHPTGLVELLLDHTRYASKHSYLLCASAYTAKDFNLVGAYRKKAFKWGYFPAVMDNSIEMLLSSKPQTKIKIIWVGRLITWKHPDHAIEVAKNLKEAGYPFSMDIIGIGSMEKDLHSLILQYDLEDEIRLLGSMSPEKVREYMEGSNIFLFTSDFNEGWGAVLNEAMNSGCAVVASHAIGSVPFLIVHKVNGLIYRNGDLKDISFKVMHLIDNRTEREYLARNAYLSIVELWNGKVAAERLVQLSDGLIQGIDVEFNEGPCSRASVISQKYHYE